MKTLKRKMSKTVGAVSALVFMFALALPAHATSVEFEQLNWLGEEGEVLVPCSKVGVATFHLDSSDLLFLQENGGGFINAVTAPEDGGPQWSIRNLYLNYPNVDYMLNSLPAVQFDLGTENGRCLSGILFDIVVSPDALGSAPSPDLVFSSLTLVDFHSGGRNDGGSGFADIPFTIGPWTGCVYPFGCFTSGLSTTLVPSIALPAVAEGKNGCAPGSVARSIKYMMGDGADPAQTIYDDLYRTMHTNPQSGTTDPNMLQGKIQYTNSKGLPIRSRLVYWNDIGGDLSTVMDVLGRGGDVEILISWRPRGGHAAMVKSIVKRADGSYEITYVDDPSQGDGVAKSTEHVITVDSNGNFPGGHVDGFLVEERTDL